MWKSIKPFLRDYENEDNACIIIDDMLMHKPWSKVNDVVCWHYDHVSQKMQKGILMLNFHYTDATGISIPLGYEIITKTENKWSEEHEKNIRLLLKHPNLFNGIAHRCCIKVNNSTNKVHSQTEPFSSISIWVFSNFKYLNFCIYLFNHNSF